MNPFRHLFKTCLKNPASIPMRKRILLTLFYIIGCAYGVASFGRTNCNMAPADSADMLMQADTARANGGTTENARREQGIIRRVCNYFLDANKTSANLTSGCYLVPTIPPPSDSDSALLQQACIRSTALIQRFKNPTSRSMATSPQKDF